MLGWVIVFLVLAVLAAIFGFGGVASLSFAFAKILFWVFIVLLAISLIVWLAGGRRGYGPGPLP